MQVDEPISGVCDNSNVIAVLPIPGNGQLEAIGSLSDEQIQKKLNEEVTFLADKPGYRDKGMVRLIISCRGQLVQCVIDNKTQYPELDQQIVAVFSQLDEWQAGSINGRSVDTVKLYSFEIKNGIITLWKSLPPWL